jgi:hypothetical protein
MRSDRESGFFEITPDVIDPDHACGNDRESGAKSALRVI